MKTKKRRDYPGLEVHAIVNALDGEPLFRDEYDKRKLGERYANVLADSDVESLAFAIMDTHAHSHLVAGDSPYSIGRFMRRVWSPDSQRFNLRHGKRGHRLRSQYFRIEIRRPRHSFNTFRYAHMNPLLAGIVRSLRELEAYRWTSLPEVLGMREPAWISRSAVLQRFGEDESLAIERIRAFLRAGAESREWRNDMNDLLWRFPKLRLILPARDLVEETRAIIALSGATVGISPEEWNDARSDTAWNARGLAAWLLTEKLCLSQQESAHRLGVARGSMTRLREIGRELARTHSLWDPEQAFERGVATPSDPIATLCAVGGR